MSTACRYQLRKGAATVAGVALDGVTILSVGRRLLQSDSAVTASASQRRRLGVAVTMKIVSQPGQDVVSQSAMATAQSFTTALQNAAGSITANEISAALSLPADVTEASIITPTALQAVAADPLSKGTSFTLILAPSSESTAADLSSSVSSSGSLLSEALGIPVEVVSEPQAGGLVGAFQATCSFLSFSVLVQHWLIR